MARHDDGSRHISISQIGSYLAAGFVSRAWQPPSTRGPGCALNSFVIGMGAEVGFNIAREFLPRLLHAHPPVETVSFGGH
jgi:hypothetical protein